MTGPIVFRGGRAAPTPHRPRLRLGDHLDTATLPAVPPARDWLTGAGGFPMDGNDQWGDCVWAEAAHRIQSTAWFGRHATVVPTEEQVLAAYTAVTGFDPAAGPPGRNPTDQGTNMQDAQSYLLKTGLGGRKSLAYAEVDIRSMDEVCAAIDLLGAVALGINFPKSAMDQFNAGQPWDVVADDGGIQGGHAVELAGYDKTARTFQVVTWGRVQAMTWAFFRQYAEEAWVAVLPEWLDQAGQSPVGLDLHGLGEAFAQLTGRPNPFPGPAPTPSPAPVPVPPPDWSVEEFLTFLRREWDALDQWLHGHGLLADAQEASIENSLSAPAIGDTLLVRMDPRTNNGADVAPALITRVWSRTHDSSWTVNVKVLADTPDNEWKTSISLYPTRETADLLRPDGFHVGWWPQRCTS